MIPEMTSSIFKHHSYEKALSYDRKKTKKTSFQDEIPSKNSFTNPSKIKELPLDVWKRCLEFIPQDLHPYFGFCLDIKSNLFWGDFLSPDWKASCETSEPDYQRSYLKDPASRRLDLILKHEKISEIVAVISHTYFQKSKEKTGESIYFQKSFLGTDTRKTEMFFSKLILDALITMNFEFLEPESLQLDLNSLSLETLIRSCVDIFQEKIKTLTDVQRKNLSNRHVQNLFLSYILSWDDAKDIHPNASDCLSIPVVQDLVEEGIIDITDLTTISPLQLRLAFQIPMAESCFRSGSYTLQEMERLGDTCFYGIMITFFVVLMATMESVPAILISDFTQQL